MSNADVASYMGAWIETHRPQSLRLAETVASYMGAWIETISYIKQSALLASHPTWVRGLKQNFFDGFKKAVTSHPTWVRGLKPGAMKFNQLSMCRILHGCVD